MFPKLVRVALIMVLFTACAELIPSKVGPVKDNKKEESLQFAKLIEDFMEFRRYTTLELSPEEIHQIGLDEVTRIHGEMKGIMHQVGFGGSYPEFIESLRTDPQFYVETEGEYLKEVSHAAKLMDGQLPRLFRVLPKTPYGIRAMPPLIAPRQSAG